MPDLASRLNSRAGSFGAGIRRFFCLWLLLAFCAGLLPANFVAPAEAKTKKTVRKAPKRVKAKKAVTKIKKKAGIKKKKARKVVRKKPFRWPRVKKSSPVKKAPAKKTPPAETPVIVPEKAFPYQLPAGTGTISQTYFIEEGIGESEVDNLISSLKGIGADDVQVDTNKNTVSVKFNSSNLTSVGVVSKLRGLGYTVRRIN